MNELNDDYYYNSEGLIVFTEQHHLKRGYCCNNKCKHCPFLSENNNKRR